MSLRAQGALALHKGDLALAHGQYGELHQLLPDDREAGLNLALIEWRQGNKDSAVRRIARLLEKFPNDQEIQALNLNMRNP
jgi:Flp pilus assembly protein TadD